MVEINYNSSVFKYDTEGGKIFKDDVYIPPTEAEPVYSGNDAKGNPIFIGIYFIKKDTILTVSGKMRKAINQDKIK